MLATSSNMISRKASASVSVRRQLAAINTPRPSPVAAKAGLFGFFKGKEEEFEEEIVEPVKKAGGPFSFLNGAAKKAAPQAKAAIKKAAPKSSGTSLSSVLSFLPFGGAEAPTPAPAKRAVQAVKKAAPKKAAAPVFTRKAKQPYVYDGSGVEPDQDFSTVEMRRDGKMRPADLDLSKPRSYWN